MEKMDIYLCIPALVYLYDSKFLELVVLRQRHFAVKILIGIAILAPKRFLYLILFPSKVWQVEDGGILYNYFPNSLPQVRCLNPHSQHLTM